MLCVSSCIVLFSTYSVLEFEVRLFVNRKCFVNGLQISLHACCSQTIYIRAIIDMLGIKSAILLFALCLFPRIPLFLFFGSLLLGYLNTAQDSIVINLSCLRVYLFVQISVWFLWTFKCTCMSYQSLIVSSFYHFE